MGLYQYFSFNKTELTIECKISAGSIQMVGCDSEDRVKSIKPIKQSAFSKLWIEEADGVPKPMLIQLNLRCRGKVIGGFKKQSFYTWNPTYEGHYINQDFLIPLGWKEDDSYYSDAKNIIMRVTYKDNKYLDDDEVEYLEGLADISEYHARVYLQGLWGVLGEKIIEHVSTCKYSDVPTYLPIYAGMDLGWTDDTAFTIMRVDDVNRKIYVIDNFSEPKLDHIKIANKVKVLFNKHNINPGQPVYVDSEDPRLVKQLAGQQLNARSASKPKGSVINGLMIMNTYEWVIVDTLIKAKDAFNNYTWETDKKTGKPMDKPNHTHSHIPDSARYGLEVILTGFVNTFGAHVKY